VEGWLNIEDIEDAVLHGTVDQAPAPHPRRPRRSVPASSRGVKPRPAPDERVANSWVCQCPPRGAQGLLARPPPPGAFRRRPSLEQAEAPTMAAAPVRTRRAGLGLQP
jgi:hypothetical protein